jgi:hypothetical protein
LQPEAIVGQTMKKITLLIAVLLVGGLIANPGVLRFFEPAPASDDQRITDAFANRESDLQVGGRGTVVRLLPDDTTGRRHQKFILELASGQTLLVAHNIDLAPRIDGLRTGDTVAFYGEYEWNARGGVIHWTHHDPAGRHADGWLRHEGVTYQ